MRWTHDKLDGSSAHEYELHSVEAMYKFMLYTHKTQLFSNRFPALPFGHNISRTLVGVWRFETKVAL